jgi:peptidoglycan/LPS O-acetylase OafA/YrhL
VPYHPICSAMLTGLQGVRGIAAVFVIFNHVTLSLRPEIISPPSPEGILDSPFRWPFIHALFTGAPWVQTFLFISGCVNALKPVKLMCSGQHEAVVLSLSSNTFRRALRLMAPVTIATVLSWVLTQVGIYQIANISQNNWLSYTSPRPSPSFSAMLWDLSYAIYQTWTEASNYYDRNLWCMVYFLQGSMILYLFLLATAKMKPFMRMLLAAALLLWSWRRSDRRCIEMTLDG